jgi:hypothetical protein
MPLRGPRFSGAPILEECFAGGHRMLFGEDGLPVKPVQHALIELGETIREGRPGQRWTDAPRQFQTTCLSLPSRGDVHEPEALALSRGISTKIGEQKRFPGIVASRPSDFQRQLNNDRPQCAGQVPS